MNVLVTGGHITPALAVIDELQLRNQNIYFVGRRFANEREKEDTFEYKEITARGIPFFNLSTGRLQKSFTPAYFKQIGLFFAAIFRSFHIIQHVKPDVIISFGGYIALPICLVAAMMNIKIITHEQTIEPGSTNRIIAFFAAKVCLSFPESDKYFKVKGVLTGNPLRKNLFEPSTHPVIPSTNRPIIFISGGSLGSHSINLIIEQNLAKLVQKFTIIHQTGNIQEFGDSERLSKLQNPHYHVFQHLSTEEISWIYHNASLVISRSGANTIHELIALHKPAVLIPLPWSARNEQKKHAQLLKDHHVAEIFEQDADPEHFYELIEKVYNEREEYINNFRTLQSYFHDDAAQRIVDIALSHS